MVRSHPGQIVCKTLSQRPFHKNRTGGVDKVKALSSNPITAKQQQQQKPHKNQKLCLLKWHKNFSLI
jgi:hypothetical protein